MRYSSENVWTGWLHKGSCYWDRKLLMVRDFPLKYLQIFLVKHQVGFFWGFELALVHVQNFKITFEFFKLFISLEQKEHLN